MQQAIYDSIDSTFRIQSTNLATTAAPVGLLRWMACRWDLVGVVALMGSSAAYGVFALAHVGL